MNLLLLTTTLSLSPAAPQAFPVRAPLVSVGLPESWSPHPLKVPDVGGWPLRVEETTVLVRDSHGSALVVRIPVLRSSPWWYPLADVGLRILAEATRH